MIKVKKFKPTYSRTDLPLPQLDFRKDIKKDKEKSWLILQQTHKAALQAYYLVLTHLLDRVEGTSLVQIRDWLMYEHYFDNSTIEQAVVFLLTSVEVELDEASESVNRAVVFRAPRIKVSVVGPASPYTGSKHQV